MSNRAWMPLHIADYLADTGHLNAAEHGAYLMLIMHYWQNGSLPTDERLLARLARMSKAEWDDSRDVLAMLFGDNWTHKRIDAELAKADQIIEKRRNAANTRHAYRKHDASAVQVHSKSSDTGALPRTIEPSSSSFHSEDDAPLTPLSGGDEGEFEEKVWQTFPRHLNSTRADALAAWLGLCSADRLACIGGCAAYRRQHDADTSAGRKTIPKKLSTWIAKRGWEAFPAPPTSATSIVVIGPDEPDFALVQRFLGSGLVLSKTGNATVRTSDLQEARRAAA